MKIHKFWMLAAMMAVSLVTISCEDDDDPKDENGEENNETVINPEYIATSTVKEAKLTELNDWYSAYCVVYVDFNYKYVLNLRSGSLVLESFYRKYGAWHRDYYDPYTGYELAGSKDLGKVNTIADITEKIENGNTVDLMAQPQHGYAMRFKTENNEWKYLRVYIKGYTLDASEALSSITVQYQLY